VLELTAVACVFLLIPIALMLPKLPLESDGENHFWRVPYVMFATLVGWWWLGIWVPFLITILVVLLAIRAARGKSLAVPESSSREIVPSFSKPHDVWTPPAKDTTPEEVDARTRATRRRRMDEAGYSGQYEVWVPPAERILPSPSPVASVKSSITAGKTARVAPDWKYDETETADERLQERYDALADGAISLDEYQIDIEFELDLAKRNIANLREMRRYMERYDYDDQKEQADADLEAAKWRLAWVKKQIREKGNLPEWMDKSGRWARFEYADSDGVLTRQEITMWKAYPTEVRGWDRKRKQEVGYGFQGIRDWTAG
jgi:uncharacterized membrane protein